MISRKTQFVIHMHKFRSESLEVIQMLSPGRFIGAFGFFERHRHPVEKHRHSAFPMRHADHISRLSADRLSLLRLEKRSHANK